MSNRSCVGQKFWIVLTLLAGLALPPTAFANNNDLARSHFKVGQNYYRQGRYREAVAQFEQAYNYSRKPALLYNIAQAYERTGDLQKAINAYQRYLTESKSNDQATKTKIANLRKRLRQTGVLVRSSVTGATVKIDGKVIGTTPINKLIPLPPGQHQIKVVKANHTSFSAFVSVQTGAVVSVAADLQPIAATPAPTPTPTPQPKVDPKPKPTPTPTPVKPKPKQGGRLWTWVALGSGGVLWATAAITGGVALSKAKPASKGAAKALAATSDVMWGLGAAAVVTGIVLFFVEGKSDGETETKAGVRPVLGPTYAGISGRF